MRIYVAGPYSSGTAEGRLRNTNAAMDAGLALMRKGHAPFVPHLTHWMDLRAKDAEGAYRTWGEWMALDDAFLKVCDALLFLAPSYGANIELERARSLGLTIYHSVDDVPEKR